MTHPVRVLGGTNWPRLLLGLALVFALFHGVATVTGSDRGQAGLLVGALVVAATLAAERILFGEPLAKAARDVGLGRPRARGLVVASGVCALLMLVFPAMVAIEHSRVTVDPRWGALLPGLFAQAGIAEEVLFRGYLFRRVRSGRTFWRAVVLAALPFAAVHLILFATMPWPIALAAVLLSVAVGAPLARLFELGGGTIWAPALVHFTIQGAIKLVALEPAEPLLPVIWMAASAVLPFLAFLVPDPGREAQARAALVRP
jgi:membrane protease YdiL (CAAX protease family)